MKVVLPVAGKGTRLLPITREVPKPLIRIAGRPVLDHVIDTLADLDVEELIFITGHLKERIETHVRRAYDVPARFVEQRVQDGTAGAVNLARPFIDGPLLIVFVDTIFEADLTLANGTDADGVIWTKEVEDYQRFGVVVTDEHGYMRRIVEKPSEPISKLANIGLYFIRDWRTLFEGISQTLAGPQMKGEWFLTDAFQYMIDCGKRLQTAEVSGWYDCGKVETVLATNRHLLESGRARRPPTKEGVTLVDPVYVAEGVELEECTVGPNVTIETGAAVRNSTIRDTVIGPGSRLTGCVIDRSMIGNDVVLDGCRLHEMVAAAGEIAPAP